MAVSRKMENVEILNSLSCPFYITHDSSNKSAWMLIKMLLVGLILKFWKLDGLRKERSHEDCQQPLEQLPTRPFLSITLKPLNLQQKIIWINVFLIKFTIKSLSSDFQKHDQFWENWNGRLIELKCCNYHPTCLCRQLGNH